MRVENVVMLENAIEAQRISAILDEENIPHQIVSFHDTAYDGLFQAQKGWGHIATTPEFADRVAEIYGEMKDGAQPE